MDNPRLRRIGLFAAQISVVLIGALLNAYAFNALL